MSNSATEGQGQAGLRPDREQLAQFIGAMFRHADEGGFISLRCFHEMERKAAPIIASAQLNGDPGKLVDEAAHMAQVAINQVAPWMFAPPIATFSISRKAREADLACGLALSVEADHDPVRARQRLEFLLGPATVVVASGGQWTDPATGEVQDKLHLHWRLREPARTAEEHAALKQARDLACALVGADPTHVHPLRWPGSWHRKATPRLCRIVALTETELDLGEALGDLSGVQPGEWVGSGQGSGNGQSTGGTRSIGGGLNLARTFAAIEHAEATQNNGAWRFHMLRIIRSLIGRGMRDDIILAVCRQATWTKSGWTHEQTDEFVREQIKADRAKDGKPEPELRGPTEHAGTTKPQPAAHDLSDLAFHGPLGEMVLALDPHTEASALGTMASLLVMFGNALGREFYVRVGAGRHFPTLYAWLVGTTYLGRKGTAADNALLCMEQIMPEWVAYNIRRSLNSGQGIGQTVSDLDKAAKEQRDNPLGDKRCLFITAELADVLIKARCDGNTLFNTLRDCWDTGILENTSITRKLRVTGASVSWLAMITAEELGELLKLKELATGSLNRVLVFHIERSKKLPGMPPVLDPGLINPIANEATRNLKATRSYRISGATEHNISLSTAALDLMIGIKDQTETAGRTWIESGSARAFVQIIRLALIYAVADGARQIEPDHLLAAKSLVDHAGRSLATLATSDLSDPLARRILTYMREDPSEVLSRTQISINIFNKHVPARDLEIAIGLLIQLDLLTEAREPTPGRDRTVYRLTRS